jgi:hypothetical protein
MIVKVEHLLLFVVIFLLCYNLFSSCGCGKSLVDGFSVGGQLESDIKIPLCCHNLWNKLPDDIQKLRGMDTAQECRNEFMEYLSKNSEFNDKHNKYMTNFACNSTDIMNYCSYKDEDLHKWKNTINQNVIDINSSNTENSCDFLQFLNNTKMVVPQCYLYPHQPGCEYGKRGHKYIVNEWLLEGGATGPVPQEYDRWSTLKPQNPEVHNRANLCSESLNWMYQQPNPDWSNVEENGFFNIPFALAYCGGSVSTSPAIKSTFGTNLDNYII